MRLTDLNPGWVSSGGEDVFRVDPTTGERHPVPRREGVGVAFNCPCGKCGIRSYIPFENPLDGGPALDGRRANWARTGDAFETLSLHQSIRRSMEFGGCGWHGTIVNGEVIRAGDSPV